MPDLSNPRDTRRGGNIKTNFWRISSVNHNEDGTWRVDVDLWNAEADFTAGVSPLDSVQINKSSIPGILNGLENSIRSEIDV